MLDRKTLIVFELSLLVFGMFQVAKADEKATPQEIVGKVREAANTLANSLQTKPAAAALLQFDQRQGP